MAPANPAPRKRVGDYNPDVDTGETLDGIANVDVEIAKVTFDERRGRNGTYTLSIIELTDGKLYHTGSPVVAERLAAIPVNEFPIIAKFERVRSQSNPSQSYWTVG